jgi:uncharacterized membrane protein YbaN (DUF454 family)
MNIVTKRRLLLLAGVVCTGLGIVGIFIPILPTTPFLLLAAACFLRSSERFYRLLLDNRFLGAYIRNNIEGRGMPLKLKIATILLLWLTMGLTITFAVENLAVRIILIIIAIGVTTHICLIRTKER